ncbi:expressed unknown protein [Seminavis robusta]|uniref:Uncharacterized protein n=1 Tax=Seminavis robusta TaxID=568900 RepID=A0A9N8ES44_9STRA|nr:expressed unknown protein [Seminavis robusta]|eukprot:Sro1787_g297480.1 n/a (666) ;mRNA; r:3196-5193
MSSTTSSESDMGANKARSIRHASQRKAYHLTEQEDDKFVITETRLAYGKQRTFPNKWQVQVSNRQPLHTSQRPSKSILRRRHQATDDAGVDQLQARLATMSLHKNKVRFTNRNDQRFYIKMSESVQQLVKMTNNSHKGKNCKNDATTSSGDFVLVEISSSEDEEDCNTTTTIQEITEAVQTGQPVKEILHLLQDHQELAALHHHQDNKTTDNDDWLATLYRQVKSKLQHDGDDKCNDRHNLEQIKKLLNIYKTAESVIASSRALKQWSRFQVTVESISNLQTLSSPDDALVADMVYRSSSSSNKQPKQSSQPLGPTTALADFIDATTGRQIQGSPAPKYCINHNFGLTEERPELTFTVSSQGEEGDATTQPVGHVRIPCALFRFFSTQPKETYSLDQRLVPVQQSSSNQSSSSSNNNTVRVKFAIQKVPLKKDFLNKKRAEVAVNLQMIVDWIHRFNQENKDSAELSSHILCSNSGLSLLHAAILVQDRSCVQQILALGANPFHNNSTAGSAMNLALNMMDRYDHRPHDSSTTSNHQKLFWDMIQDLQQSTINRSSSHHASSGTPSTQQHSKGEDDGTEKENHRGRRKLKLGHHHGPHHRSKSSSKSRSKSRTDGGTEKENQRGRKLKQGQQHAPQHRSKSSSKVRSKSRTGSRPLTDRRSKAGQ